MASESSGLRSPGLITTNKDFTVALMTSQPGKEVLSMTVTMGQKRHDTIVVHENDIPFQLAQQFCFQNNLPSKYIKPLTLQLVKSLQNLAQSASEDPQQGRGFKQSGHTLHDFDNQFSAGHMNSPRMSKNATQSARKTVKFHSPHREESDKKVRRPTSAPSNRSASKLQLQNSVVPPVFERLWVTHKKVEALSPEEQVVVRASPSNSRIDPGCWSERLYSEAFSVSNRKATSMKQIQKERNLKVQQSAIHVDIEDRLQQQTPIFDRLYEDGLKKLAQKSELETLTQQQRDEEEAKSCSFKPHISQRAQSMTMPTNFETHFDAHGKIKREKIKQRMQYGSAIEAAECTFAPKINPSSEIMFGRRNTSTSFDSESFLDTARANALSIARLSLDEVVALDQFGNTADKKKSHDSVVARLLNAEQDRMHQIDTLRQLTSHRDMKTGQELWKPFIQSPLNVPSRNPRKLAVGDYLFQQSYALAELKKSLVIKDIDEHKQRANPSISSKSLALAEQLRQKRLEFLFKELDVHRRGVLSLQDICAYVEQHPQDKSVQINNAELFVEISKGTTVGFGSDIAVPTTRLHLDEKAVAKRTKESLNLSSRAQCIAHFARLCLTMLEKTLDDSAEINCDQFVAITLENLKVQLSICSIASSSFLSTGNAECY
jgi:hypothetical protein